MIWPRTASSLLSPSTSGRRASCEQTGPSLKFQAEQVPTTEPEESDGQHRNIHAKDYAVIVPEHAANINIVSDLLLIRKPHLTIRAVQD